MPRRPSGLRLFVVVDYNLTRIDDVRLLTTYARQAYGLHTVLVRENPQRHDFELADHVLAMDPRRAGFAEDAAAALRRLGEPAAVAPFSDDAVASGAALAQQLDVVADSPTLADAAYSKDAYRRREHMHQEVFEASGVRVPDFALVRTYTELRDFAERCPGGFVVKPTCEGNNRGVLRLGARDDLRAAFVELSPFVSQGLICEELIDWSDEYSFDGIGHLSFVTQKLTAAGRYPVERGQTVNASLPATTIAAVQRAGMLANLICGQRLGPFHNEVKVDSDHDRAAVIEPNRRPAGMSIWHLAARVHGVDFFRLWVDQLVCRELPATLPPARGTAAIRMLAAPADGVWMHRDTSRRLEDDLFEAVQSAAVRGSGPEVEFSDFKLIAADGDRVFATPRDNSHFVAKVSAYSSVAGTHVSAALNRFETAWRRLAHPLVSERENRHHVTEAAG